MDAYRVISPASRSSCIELGTGQLAGIEDGRGMRINVESGSVWITQENCTEDVFLEAGASFQIARNGLTLVGALGHAAAARLRLERDAVRRAVATPRQPAADRWHPAAV